METESKNDRIENISNEKLMEEALNQSNGDAKAALEKYDLLIGSKHQRILENNSKGWSDHLKHHLKEARTRRNGKTTRLIDAYVQMFFQFGYVEVCNHDHQSKASNEDIAKKMAERIRREHKYSIRDEEWEMGRSEHYKGGWVFKLFKNVSV